jgi:6-phosphogluconolactonase
MACSLTEFNLDGRSGTPTMVASLPTLSRPATPADTAAELLIHPSGKWLYASTRGANSIAVFGLYADGKLTRTEIVGAGVKTPRGMAIDPLGRYLIVAGQASDDLTTFEIDPTSGKLTPTGQRVSVPKPVSIAFFSGFKGN